MRKEKEYKATKNPMLLSELKILEEEYFDLHHRRDIFAMGALLYSIFTGYQAYKFTPGNPTLFDRSGKNPLMHFDDKSKCWIYQEGDHRDHLSVGSLEDFFKNQEEQNPNFFEETGIPANLGALVDQMLALNPNERPDSLLLS
jgi:serine/threonine protein kinase